MNIRPLRAQMLPESYTDRELDLGRVFALDNGAFTYWQKGGRVDVPAYVAWVQEWARHPGFDWAVIPDAIDGGEDDTMFIDTDYGERWTAATIDEAIDEALRAAAGGEHA